MDFAVERIRRIITELKENIYPTTQQIEYFMFKEGAAQNGQGVDLDTTGWEKFYVGDSWGGKDKHFWFRAEVEIPEAFDGKKVVFHLTTGTENGWDAINPQFLVYVNGELQQGFDVNHREVILTEKAVAGEKFLIALDAYAGAVELRAEIDGKLKVLDTEIERLYYNIKVPLDIAVLYKEQDKNRIEILKHLYNAINILDLRKTYSDGYYASIDEANKYMEEEFYGEYCGHNDVIAHCVGHTHIDVAWRWTVAQTREKSARSFSTVLNLMKSYPEYIFMSSQPQLYKYVKEDQPELYQRIKDAIADGVWEPEGAMWLEADCNLTSGESLVRQVLFGTRFFKDEFGMENEILWLPDVFGYSAALPQILKKSGINYFMTTKISWNEYNKMPNDTFMWKGIDGTDILTHFITTRNASRPESDFNTTYNGSINADQVLGTWNRYQHKDLTNEVMICFGHGDGGGGATKEMLENARRLSKGIPGCPKVKMGNSLDFFKKLDKTVQEDGNLPSWNGELYLEYHRGTYTTMAKNKKFNRKCEFMLQDIELLSSMEKAMGISNYYPQQEINKNWEVILLNQFHDIIPGSSIKEVYEVSTEEYKATVEEGNNMRDGSVANIASAIKLDATSVVVFNNLSFVRDDIAEFDLPEGWENAKVYDGDTLLESQLVYSKTVAGKDTSKVVFTATGIPSKGYKTFKLEKCDAVSNENEETLYDVLSNKYFDIKFDKEANISSIFDKREGRELLKEGMKANQMQAFEDKPHNYDAWDINIYYQEKMWEVNELDSFEIIEQGPVRSTVRVKRSYMDSVIVQDITSYSDIDRIDFKTYVDWQETQTLLKTAFPLDINTNKATYDIQFGNVERPTHWNTSWDKAKFEVCAHKWADVSETGFGVSLLNDCKYGHDIKDGQMRLTLLKAPLDPSPVADKEEHEFVYSLYPHQGDWKEADTVQMAFEVNSPLVAKVEDAHTGSLPQEFSFIGIDCENVIIDTVKKAEDTDELIVRVFECYNKRIRATLTFAKDLGDVYECDLMEKNDVKFETEGDKISFEIKPFEIKTFKINMK